MPCRQLVKQEMRTHQHSSLTAGDCLITGMAVSSISIETLSSAALTPNMALEMELLEIARSHFMISSIQTHSHRGCNAQILVAMVAKAFM